MSEVAISRFHGMSAELAVRVHATLEEYAREHGHVYDPLAMHQSDVLVSDLARDALTFGMDVWPHGSSGEDLRGGGNVVLLSDARRAPAARPSMRTARVALSTIGAVIGTTIVAAATTDYVDIPGIHRVAEVIYRHNAAPVSDRIVEINGRMLHIRFVRREGEPYDVVHVEKLEAISPEAGDPVAEFDDSKEHG